MQNKTSRPTTDVAKPMLDPSGGTKTGRDQRTTDIHALRVTAAKPTDRQCTRDAHSDAAVGAQTRDPAAVVVEVAIPNPGPLLDLALAAAADVVDDLEKVRIANANRLSAMTRSTEDKDGEIRGLGYDESHPDVARLAAIVATLERIEHDAELNLNRKMRQHPLGPWVAAQKGVGEKQAARLIAVIGDPYWNTAIDAPRTVSALWAYCGLHVIDGESVRRKRGQQCNWSTRAKMRAFLIAESCKRQNAGFHAGTCVVNTAGWLTHKAGCECSPYRVVFDNRRTHTASTHPDWTDGRAQADALRVASKAILRDLWCEAKRIHQGGSMD